MTAKYKFYCSIILTRSPVGICRASFTFANDPSPRVLPSRYWPTFLECGKFLSVSLATSVTFGGKKAVSLGTMERTVILLVRTSTATV